MITIRSCWYPSKPVCWNNVMGRQRETPNIRLTDPDPSKRKAKALCAILQCITHSSETHTLSCILSHPTHKQHKLSCHIHILSTYPYCIFKHTFQVSRTMDKRHDRRLPVWQKLNNKVTSKLPDGRTQNIQIGNCLCQWSEEDTITHYTHPFEKFFWANSCTCVCSKFHFTNFLVNFLHKMNYEVNQFMFIHLLCMEVSY